MISSFFVAHGSPMVAIQDTEYARFLETLGKRLPRPKAIIVFSAHWESSVQMVSDALEHTTMYDFGGFPKELYQVKYQAKGDSAITREVQSLLSQSGVPSSTNSRRGLDHGVWTILRRLHPNADIPLVAMSVNPDLTPAQQYRIGQALSPLRNQDVLIIGSGVTVHNFQLFSVRDKAQVQTMAYEFEAWLAEHLKEWDLDALFQYATLAPHANIAVPPYAREHFVPLFYAMGAADEAREVKQLNLSLDLGVFTNSIYQFG